MKNYVLVWELRGNARAGSPLRGMRAGFSALGISAALLSWGCATSEPVVTEPAEPGAAANSLHAEIACSTTKARVGMARFSWVPVAGAEQRVEVTIRRDGFERGLFDASETLPAGQNVHV